MVHTQPKLVVLSKNPSPPDDGSACTSSAPITLLRRHPVARLTEHFAAQHHSDGVIRLLQVVGVDEEASFHGKKLPFATKGKLYLPCNSRKSATVRALHHEFAKAHLGQTRSLLSRPAQSLYDHLLEAANAGWVSAAGLQVSTQKIRDPISGRITTEYTSDGDPLTFGMPHGGQAEGRQVSVPECLTAGMQTYLVDHMEELEKSMGRKSTGYTREQTEHDHNLIRNRVLPLITYYPPLRCSFLHNSEIRDFVGHALKKTLEFAKEQEKKPAAGTNITRMRLWPGQQPRCRDGQPVYPESPS